MKYLFENRKTFAIVIAILLFGSYISIGCEKNSGPNEPDVIVDKPEIKRVALTFDDGPDTLYTPLILDILARENVKATFFIIGNRALMHPEIVKREHNEGHIIGNHTFDHYYLPHSSFSRVISNIDHTERIIDSLVGNSPKLFRPPWGAIEKAQVDSLENHGYKVVLWDNNDPVYEVNAIVSAIVDNIAPNDIILLHDSNFGNKQDRMVIVKAVPLLIDKLKNLGYTFVTADKIDKNKP
jgi:peptidoglycan-N-acetylglucosamine deacetylase